MSVLYYTCFIQLLHLPLRIPYVEWCWH